MQIEQLKQLLQRRIEDLQFHLSAAELRGDVEAVLRIETELEETRQTLQKLQS